MPLTLSTSRSPVLWMLLGVLACTSATSPDERAFADALARWRGNGPANYSYRSSIGCYCPPDYIAPVTITVRNGVVESVTDRATGAARALAGRTTIDSLFSLVATEIRVRPERLKVTYDATAGYPRSLTYGTPENDGGGYISADSLVAIP
jgi:hypothetical protein